MDRAEVYATITDLLATATPAERDEIAREVRALVQDARFRLDHGIAADTLITVRTWDEKDTLIHGRYIPPVEPLNLGGVEWDGKVTVFSLPVVLREKLQKFQAGALVAIMYLGQSNGGGRKQFEVA